MVALRVVGGGGAEEVCRVGRRGVGGLGEGEGEGGEEDWEGGVGEQHCCLWCCGGDGGRVKGERGSDA